MKTLYRSLHPPGRCEYLHDQRWQLEYEEVEELSKDEYHTRLVEGWRRFGHSMFRPQCPHCRACQSIRICVSDFQPNRTQRRIWQKNTGRVAIVRTEPSLTQEKLDLSIQFHHHQEREKSWTEQRRTDPLPYFANFIHNPFPTEEWDYFDESHLAGVGFVDVLPDGLSAIYFFYDPDLKDQSLGTFNILSLIAHAKELKLPYVYLGYYVAGSRSMAYKANFRPHELLSIEGSWVRQELTSEAASHEPQESP